MWLLIVLAVGSALVQSRVASDTAAISGQVLEEGSQTPVAGAQVTLFPLRAEPVRPFPGRSLTAATDHDGRYEVDGLEAGRYGISVRKAGFAPVEGSGVQEVEIDAGERREAVSIRLQRAGALVGRVLDESGEPLTDVRVMAMRKPDIPRNASLIQSDFLVPAGPGGQTNDLGEFRLFSLPAGEYYVQATARSEFGRSFAPRGRTLLPTYFPAASDAGGAEPIRVAAGQTISEIEVRMIGAPAFQISGTVLDQAGRPVVNAVVRLIADDESARHRMFTLGPWDQARTDTSGRFTINNVTDGSYTLLAIAPVVISGPSAPGGAAGAGGMISHGVSGFVAGGVTSETRDGTTTEYHDDRGSHVSIIVNGENVSGLQVTVRLH